MQQHMCVCSGPLVARRARVCPPVPLRGAGGGGQRSRAARGGGTRPVLSTPFVPAAHAHTHTHKNVCTPGQNTHAPGQARRYIAAWEEASKEGTFSAFQGMKAFTFDVLVNQVGWPGG